MSARDGIGMTSERTRLRMIESLRREGVTNERVLAAMTEIPRHIFVEEGIASRAYEDTPLPIGHGQTISSPTIVGTMTQLLLEKAR
jgi:protein-L-isoaspartate(D-aspartate) O-methyltransferase